MGPPRSLTLQRFCEYDDILSDCLVDRIYFWSRIHKLRKNYHPSRNVTDQTIIALVKDLVIKQKKLSPAVESFVLLPGIYSFFSKLTDCQKQDFFRHARQYFSLYLPTCGFEIGTTDRYASSKIEACILATREYKPGDEISHLSGTALPMTTEEEEQFQRDGRDFSIIYSSRLDAMCLFLGPARLINHDCESNCRFLINHTTVTMIVQRPIALGEEVTTFYGDCYFGKNNADCLCATCERKQQGGHSRHRSQKVSSTDESELSPKSVASTSSLTEYDDDDFDSEIQQSRFTASQLRRRKSLRRTRREVSLIPTKKQGRKRKQAICTNPNCYQDFIDPDMSTTCRAYCPRCSRHLILFELIWPKRTRKSNDTEEYISDPRSIFRSISRAELKRVEYLRDCTGEEQSSEEDIFEDKVVWGKSHKNLRRLSEPVSSGALQRTRVQEMRKCKPKLRQIRRKTVASFAVGLQVSVAKPRRLNSYSRSKSRVNAEELKSNNKVSSKCVIQASCEGNNVEHLLFDADDEDSDQGNDCSSRGSFSTMTRPSSMSSKADTLEKPVNPRLGGRRSHNLSIQDSHTKTRNSQMNERRQSLRSAMRL